MRTRVLLMLIGLLAASVASIAPAQAASRVNITNQLGTGKVDPKYATTLTVSGSGFQSIKGGHGGIYIFFGTTKGQWRPSKGGQTGRNYLYVPDSETKSNQGFQKFVAFPGSDTAGSANGGTIKADGSWSTTMVVPGASFKAVNRDGKATTIDCLKVTCGIITVGAHGVKNARNETFTPVIFADLYAGKSPAATTSGGEQPVAAPSDDAAAAAPKATGKPTLAVDRTTAVAGRVLTFTATGLTPGDQIVASLDDGLAAVGPLSVGPNGQVAGTLGLPATIGAGTHELRLSGTASTPSVTFPVAAAETADEEAASTPWVPIGFAAFGGLALLGALAFSVMRLRTVRRRAVHAI